MVKLSQEIKAGIFVAGAFLILGLSIWTLGSEKEIFSTQELYLTSFTDVKGLAPGAPIRLGGITIGRVSEIGFAQDLTDPRIYVQLLINEKYIDRVREDSMATIETQGLLGDRFVTISQGQNKQVSPGSVIKSAEPPDISKVLDKAAVVVDSVTEISTNINAFFKGFDKESVGGIGDAFKQFGKLAKDIEKQEGLLHKLIYPRKGEKDALEELTEASRSLKSTVDEIKSGDGILHALVYEKGGKETVKSLGDAAKNLATTATHISDLAEKIKTGEGILHSAIYNKSPAGLDDIIAKLNDTAENLKKASLALSEGSGTIGALLVDSKLYDNLVEVTDGAKRSIILRHAIRSSMKRDENASKKTSELLPSTESKLN